MEQFEAKGIPKFTSPEEEIAFLRAEIARKEGIVRAEGVTPNTEKLAEETLHAYKQAERADVLHKSQITPAHEEQAIVLALKPESHDRTMEELLGILLTKGVKNVLSIIEGLKNPHIDDDFHRFLVQYLRSAKDVPGLREGSPLWKGIDMKLFEITLPAPEEGARGYKEFIAAMEQFYAGMQAVGGHENPDRHYYTLEIALPESGTDVFFYAGVPSSKADLLEKQVLSFYHDAKLKEITDDYNVFNETGYSVGSYAKVSDLEIYPIKTHDEIEHDPMNVLVNAFSKLKEKGEGAAVQFTIVPAGDMLVKRFTGILDRVKFDHVKAKDAYEGSQMFGKQAGSILKEFIFSSSKPKDKEEKTDERGLELIQKKIASTIQSVGIRITASGETLERAESILHEIQSAFNQFYMPGSNGLDWVRIEKNSTQDFLHNFSYRQLVTEELFALNFKELSTLFHFPIGVDSTPQLKQAQAAIAPAPSTMGNAGVLLGTNVYRGDVKQIYMSREDRMRHFYVIGQTGTGKTTILKNIIAQDIANGDGCCFIDPHGTDLQDILSYIPPERIDDVIYFDPAYTARPMGLNMLEYDERYPEQKTFVVNELLAIFNKLFDMKTAGGPAFEQYFRNSALLVMEDPASGSTLLEIGRVMADKAFRDLKLSRCKNPIIQQFWENAEKTTGEQSLANFVPYITNKFDVFVSNDIMRPVIAQQESVFNFRKIMDEGKILLVNLSKGRLGDINANLLGLIIVGKIQMAALSRVDMYGQNMRDFYLYIDEFQNVTTDSIASILSEARKYRLSLNVAHQYISQLEEPIKNAVFGNVGSMAVFRVGPDDSEYLAKQFEPVFTGQDIMKLENRNAYMKMLVDGTPVKPFNIATNAPPKGNHDIVEKIKELSYLKYGRERAEVEEEIMVRYRKI